MGLKDEGLRAAVNITTAAMARCRAYDNGRLYGPSCKTSHEAGQSVLVQSSGSATEVSGHPTWRFVVHITYLVTIVITQFRSRVTIVMGLITGL